MTRFVNIAEFWTVYDAAVAQTALQNAGILAVNTDWYIFNLYPHLMVATSGPRLLVPENDLEYASQILVEGYDNAAPVYPCPKCQARTYRMRRWWIVIPVLIILWGAASGVTYGPLAFYKRKRFCWTCYHQHLPAPVEPFTEAELGYTP